MTASAICPGPAAAIPHAPPHTSKPAPPSDVTTGVPHASDSKTARPNVSARHGARVTSAAARRRATSWRSWTCPAKVAAAPCDRCSSGPDIGPVPTMVRCASTPRRWSSRTVSTANSGSFSFDNRPTQTSSTSARLVESPPPRRPGRTWPGRPPRAPRARCARRSARTPGRRTGTDRRSSRSSAPAWRSKSRPAGPTARTAAPDPARLRRSARARGACTAPPLARPPRGDEQRQLVGDLEHVGLDPVEQAAELTRPADDPVAARPRDDWCAHEDARAEVARLFRILRSGNDEHSLEPGGGVLPGQLLDHRLQSAGEGTVEVGQLHHARHQEVPPLPGTPAT